MTNSILSKQCSITNCERKYLARNLCSMHYQRRRSNGDPLIVRHNLGVGDTEEERFWDRVEITADTTLCWLWKAGIGGNGYGSVRINGIQQLAHRISWFYTYGKMPTQFVLHSCDVRLCVNPNHLREGTYQDNADDKVSRNRQSCLQGERHGMAKLTESQVISIRKMYASGGTTQAQLASEMGVTATMIGDIVRRNRWKHI